MFTGGAGLGWAIPSPVRPALGRPWALTLVQINKLDGLGLSGRKHKSLAPPSRIYFMIIIVWICQNKIKKNIWIEKPDLA